MHFLRQKDFEAKIKIGSKKLSHTKIIPFGYSVPMLHHHLPDLPFRYTESFFYLWKTARLQA